MRNAQIAIACTDIAMKAQVYLPNDFENSTVLK
jgi:hypothetical protein